MWRGTDADDAGDPRAERAVVRRVRAWRAVGAFARRERGAGEKNVLLHESPRALCTRPCSRAGCFGGVAQSFIVSPFELVKIKQQSAGVGAGVVLAAARELTSALARGVLSEGLGATLLRDGVPHGVWFVAYEWSKTALEERFPPKDVNGKPAAFAAAAPLAAGAFAATRRGASGTHSTSSRRACRRRCKTRSAHGAGGDRARDGPRGGGGLGGGLYRFNMKLLRAVPASAVAFFAYEGMRWLDEQNPASEGKVEFWYHKSESGTARGWWRSRAAGTTAGAKARGASVGLDATNFFHRLERSRNGDCKKPNALAVIDEELIIASNAKTRRRFSRVSRKRFSRDAPILSVTKNVFRVGESRFPCGPVGSIFFRGKGKVRKVAMTARNQSFWLRGC